ncbi:DUF4426 domain-containing protein [Agaribacterium haliotis]|uniref:DUF4426 domain-containing protein n=1 Tax=Agaribacterium haliotis TaxID=2013869 RepID=UPI000BB570B1|nr:DUF4426 domain-containing protein [Agaribacterium haliotis]
MNPLRKLLAAWCAILLVAAPAALADIKAPQSHSDFDQYSVHYSVFNSTFIPADVAKIYGIKRSAYESLINVSIYNNNKPMQSIAADINGRVRNLLQQSKKLDFIEIKEKNAVYYIAPVRINGEEVVHFELKVTPDGSNETLNVNFNKKLYSD